MDGNPVVLDKAAVQSDGGDDDGGGDNGDDDVYWLHYSLADLHPFEADVAECKLVQQLEYLQPEVSLEDLSQALLEHDLVFGPHQW